MSRPGVSELNVLGFEPFDSGSHRAVRDSITRHSRHRWTWLTRPGRAWKWRMRTAALELIDEARSRDLLSPPPDVIFATSLLSAADLRAALPRGCRDVPLVLYMHENQAAYPRGADTNVPADWDAHFALTNLASVLTADRIIWNSRWNRDSFIRGIVTMLQRAPDGRLSDIDARVLARSTVIWPPVESAETLHNTGERRRGLVAWPHRWEHDKGPDELLELVAREPDLRWVILGESFETIPEPLRELPRRYAERIEHIGFEPDRARYLQWLEQCEWVASTARHEFFGIAVVEALQAGCLPWLPPRLSYPELVPDLATGLSPAHPPDDPAAVRNAITDHLAPARADRAVALLDDRLETA